MTAVNPDRSAVLRFIEQPEPMDMPTSRLLESLSARLESYERDSHRLRMSFRPPELFRQGSGVIQGGAVGAMLDFAMAFSGMAAVGVDATVTSLSLSTNFLRAADTDVVTATGWIERVGRRVAHARAELIEGDKLVASATSTLLVLPNLSRPGGQTPQA